MIMDSVLQCAGLFKSYGSHPALNGITLSLPKGRIIGLLGPNGCGKTTFIKLATGLLTPTSGSILINGRTPDEVTKSQVSYLPEHPYFGRWMTVKQTLDFFSDFYIDFDRTRAEEMLGHFGIETSASIKSLSKGNCEKVQLVLVMSRRASLYLLDEPIAGVDPAARDFILKTIITNYDPQATIILSTHLIYDIEKILDEYIFLSNGNIVAYDSVDNTRQRNGKSIDELFREVFRC